MPTETEYKWTRDSERNVNALNAVHFCENTECRRQKICNMLFEWLKRDAQLFLTLHSVPYLSCGPGAHSVWCAVVAYAKQENWKWIYENWKWHLNARSFCIHRSLSRCVCVSFGCRAHHLLDAIYQLSSTVQRHNQTKSLSISSCIITFNRSCCIATNNQRRSHSLSLSLSLRPSEIIMNDDEEVECRRHIHKHNHAHTYTVIQPNTTVCTATSSSFKLREHHCSPANQFVVS